MILGKFCGGSFGDYANNNYNNLINATSEIDIGSEILLVDSDFDGMQMAGSFII